MEQSSLSQTHLESLSTADLVALAENYGIDIPGGLNRRFIIGEILEIVEDTRRRESDAAALVDADFMISPEVLPETYNETSVTILMRDPGWVFVFWDFHSNLFMALTTKNRFESFFLRVNSRISQNESEPVDYYDIDIGTHDRKWYVHLPPGSSWCRVDLCIRNSQEKEQLLAKSLEVLVPSSGIVEAPHETMRKLSPLLELSGLADLRKSHFRNHRQSFV